MATFQKLTDVTVTDVISEQANVFVEDGGELKRVAKSQVGGAGSLADLKDIVYFHINFDMLSSAEPAVASAESTIAITCNKTFDEVLSLILNHELKMVTGVIWYEDGWNQTQLTTYDWWLTSETNDGQKVFNNSADCIYFNCVCAGEAGSNSQNITLCMYPDGSITTGNSGAPS